MTPVSPSKKAARDIPSQVHHAFLGLEPSFADYGRAKFALLPIPYDATTCYQSGTRYGPDAILGASDQQEMFDDELGIETYRAGIATLPAIAPNAAGPESMHEDIFKVANKVVRDGKFLFGLGGEHGVTSALVRAVAGKHKDFSILQIDAHLDLRDSYQNTRYSHATVMRRCLDYTDVIVPVGIRSVCLEEHRFMKQAGITPIMARECHESDAWIELAMSKLGKNVYVTIDIDGFDPAYAPGTGTPEPGGMNWQQVTGLLRRVAKDKHIVGADIVEVMPIPGQAVTEFLAAKLTYRFMGYIVAAEQGKL